jgi:alpha-glucosidase
VTRWDRSAVIYQIYPRSFFDSNGDGVGDLNGITAKLDYVASLGVDAIWISPFFTSPMKDFGYDVSNPRDVDPIFGTLADFDGLVERAHALDLKVLIDQVLSHSSDEHPWFLESRRSREGPKADWYVWADANEDGTPPNNWLSVFGGSAWRWESRREQYYLHNFLAEQPDFNLHNPDVRAALVADVKFWLDRGVDGFRLDAINFAFHDTLLRNNPPAKKRPKSVNPHNFQEHVYGSNRSEVLDFLAELRTLFDRYDATSVGEIGGGDAIRLARDYTTNQRLHMVYTFELLDRDGGAASIRERVQAQLDAIEDGWICWSFGNHDVPRLRTRWDADDARMRAYLMLSFCLRGACCLYQGDELGLPEADVPYERIVDPYGRTFWPEFKGRDGCRTPMPWTSAVHGGFTTGEPWLPVPDEHRALAVDQGGALLDAVRAFLGWRRAQADLREGDLAFEDAPDGVLRFARGGLTLAFNLSDAPVTLELPPDDAGAPGATAGSTLAPGDYAIRR